MKFIFLLCVVLVVLALNNVQGQFDDNEDFQGGLEEPEQPQQTLTLTRESLESLLQMLTPTCRTEMEGAISNNGEVSNECRREIQEGLISLNIAPTPTGNDAPSEPGTERRKREEAPRRTEAVPDEGNGQKAVFAIVALVVLFFGSAATYVIYYNKVHGTADSKKLKKLSKKKEEKMRMKQGYSAAM